jgi:DNA-binding protein H-NS
MAGKATVDLDKLNLDELKTLSKDIEKAIARKETENVRKAREAAEAAAKQYGLTLQDVLGGAGKRKLSAPAAGAKFRNPQASDQTWSGRGRQPQWFKDALAAGKSPADLAI